MIYSSRRSNKDSLKRVGGRCKPSVMPYEGSLAVCGKKGHAPIRLRRIPR